MHISHSPIEKPGNLEKIESILHDLESLGYFWRYVDVWFWYMEISPEIQSRFDNFEQFYAQRPMSREGCHREIFMATPSEAKKLLIPPYPTSIDLHFGPSSWNDGEQIRKECRVVGTYNVSYSIGLDANNDYHISRVPGEKPALVYTQSELKLKPESGTLDGIPKPCIDHSKFSETCIPRLRQIIGIFESSGLPKKLNLEYN